LTPSFLAIAPNRKENGIPTNWTMRIEAIKEPSAIPISAP
jgi:hypothetical protein